MNKWDSIAFACFFIGLGMSFNIISDVITNKEAVRVVKFLLFASGGYLLWFKGRLFNLSNQRK